MSVRALAIFALLFVTAHWVQGQTSLRLRKVPLRPRPFRLDTLSADPATLQVLGDSLLTLKYDFATNRLSFPDTSQYGGRDSVRVSYRALPFEVGRERFLRDVSQYDSGLYRPENIRLKRKGRTFAPTQRQELFKTPGLQKSGAYTRGLSVGNRQDVFLNSTLDLQLQGYLAEDVELTAAITDRNVPFQPEGNTQQIQEFDRVYIRLKRKRTALTAGDLEFRNDSSHFLRFFKSVQGAQLEHRFGSDSARFGASSRASVAQAKGRFRSYFIDIEEGVQGPYRLRGADGERFVVVIAGSERVWLDGRLLERGFDRDYVIDYNLAEITFSDRVLITEFARVRVDFEYSVQNFSRTIVEASHRQRLGDFRVFGAFYREADNENEPLFGSLDEEDREALSLAGDSLDLALASTVDTVESFEGGRILYTSVDTAVGGVTHSVLRRAEEGDAPLLSASFSEVPEGDYVPDAPSANGQVFRWVAPVGGVSQGTHAPVRLLPAPNSRQMAVFGGEWQADSSQAFYGEMAFSQQDFNLYSSRDDSDNDGQAFKVGYRNRGKAVKGIGFLAGWQWKGAIDYEQDSRDFRPIDRFRSAEFDRDWSTDVSARAKDRIFNASVGLENGRGEAFGYRYSQRERAGEVSGFQQELTARKRLWKRLQANLSAFWLESERRDDRSSWRRLSAEAVWKGGRFQPGYRFQTDRNAIAEGDSVTRTVMYFDAHTAFLQSGDSSKADYRFSYTYREDYAPVAGEMRADLRSQTAEGTYALGYRTGRVQVNAAFRKAEPLREDSLASRFRETVQGRLDWQQRAFGRSVDSRLTVTTGAGRERRRQFVFVQVDQGAGTHAWRDDNEDGQQDLAEFYVALNPDERNYAKFFTPTDEYVPAFSGGYDWRLDLAAPDGWRGKKARIFKDFLSKLSAAFRYRLEKKTARNDPLARLSPFVGPADDADLLSYSLKAQGSLFYGRSAPGFSAEGTVRLNERKQLLSGGFETGRRREGTLSLRRDFSQRWQTQAEGRLSREENASDFLEARNYDIWGAEAKPTVFYQPAPSFRVGGGYAMKWRENRLAEEASAETEDDGLPPERAFLGEAQLEARYAQAGKASITGRLRYVDIRFEGEENSPAAYQMLEALRPGENYVWALDWLQSIGNGLQLTLSYNGRQSQGRPVVHFGNVQVTALF